MKRRKSIKARQPNKTIKQSSITNDITILQSTEDVQARSIMVSVDDFLTEGTSRISPVRDRIINYQDDRSLAIASKY